MQKNKLRDPGVTELLRSAEEDVKPKQVAPTVDLPATSRLRRTKRLVPQIPALTPASQWQNDPIKQ